MADLFLLQDLLEYTRDGEWGKGEPGDGLVEMAVIRGTDFGAVRYGDFSSVPTRFIPEKIAGRKVLQPGDILLETAGGTKDQPTGRTVYLSEKRFAAREVPLTCASFSRFLRVKQGLIDPRYLYWYLQSIYETREMLPYHIQHTGVARFQYTDFASQWRIPVPDRDRQVEIAELLGSLDDKIELNRRMNETLEAMAQAIFRDWFVDFGPTLRKIEGVSDPVEIMGGLVIDADRAQQLADLFPTKLGDDGLPEGWSYGTLNEVASRVSGVIQTGPFGSQLHQADYCALGVPVVMPANLTYSGFRDNSEFAYVAEDTANRLAKHRLAKGDIVYGRRGDIGRKALIGDDQAGWLCGTGCLKVRFPASAMPAEFLYYWLDQPAMVEWIRSRAIGATMPNLNTSTLNAMPFLHSSDEVALEFSKIVQSLCLLQSVNNRQIQTLGATRDLLLPKLISGEIRLSETEERLEAAQ
ncbi:restriction endonuclease subunit S [Ensifer adhaerens]|uniref:restriction endonuclease subunit S n=1 Tax=Ensifer adhaerens TaxID=106592 RepID=UPI000CF0406C|nr:restriction endonuclease subunit S [Ensifer adhaerens]